MSLTKWWEVSAGLADRVTKGVVEPNPFHKKSGLNINVLGIACVLKSGKGLYQEGGPAGAGSGPSGSLHFPGSVCCALLWLCLHTALAAPLRDQKNGGGMGPQGAVGMRKRRGADF